MLTRNRPSLGKAAKVNSPAILSAALLVVAWPCHPNLAPAAPELHKHPPPATKTAISAGHAVRFPAASSHGFEEPKIGESHTYVFFGSAPPPMNTWMQWKMTGGTGIASNGSPFTASNHPAPEGTHVAFMKGKGAITCAYAFPAGTWRLRFVAAQGRQSDRAGRQVVRVSVQGIQLAEIEFASGKYRDYVTRPITLSTASVLPVVFEALDPDGNQSIGLIDAIRLEPVAEWDDPATWGAPVPGANDDVVIPAEVVVALKGTGNEAKTVTVGGELLVGNRDTTLRSEWIMVTGLRSLFEVGTADTPFEQDFTLTLTAVDDGTNIMGAGTKFLMAMMGGTVDLHGLPKVSWTKLNATAMPAASQIAVLDPVDWEPGDEIIIAGSRHQRSTNPSPGLPNYIDYSEKKQVRSVSPDGLTVTLDTTTHGALVYPHQGGLPQVYTSPPTAAYPQGQSWTLDQRAEVGLLTHNIKIQGDTASDITKFGGHMMFMRPVGSTIGGHAYIANVELTRMGQRQKLGRYPMHWHVMLDLAKGQYFTDSSVHNTYNRAITIHGTDYVTVERNVVYQNVGHAIFLEDGAEQFNKINYNLAIQTVKPPPGEEMLPSDNELEQLQNRCPSSFWITNPNNEIIGNVAAGTEGTGFWFIFPLAPLGLSGQQPYFVGREPYKNPLGAFRDNVCHSSGSGFDVNDSIWINNPNQLNHSIRKNVAWVPPTDEYLESFTVYGCDMGVYAGIGNDKIYFTDFVIADNNENIRLAAYHTVQNSVVIANTGNVIFGGGGQRAYVVYDGAGRVRDTHLVGFDQNATWAISASGGATLHPNHLFSGLTYSHSSLPLINFPNYASWVNPNGSPVDPDCFDPQNLGNPRKWGQACRDEDGSIWGIPGSTLIGNHPMMHIAAADLTPPWAPSSFAKLSPFRFGHLRILHPGFNPAQLPDVFVKREANGAYPSSYYENCFKTDKHKQQPVIVEGGFIYTVNWNLPLVMNSIVVTLDDVESFDEAIITLQDIGAQTSLTVTNANEVFSTAELRSAVTTSYWISPNGKFWLRFVAVDKRRDVTISW